MNNKIKIAGKTFPTFQPKHDSATYIQVPSKLLGIDHSKEQFEYGYCFGCAVRAKCQLRRGFFDTNIKNKEGEVMQCDTEHIWVSSDPSYIEQKINEKKGK